jgi:hypothetical protein
MTIVSNGALNQLPVSLVGWTLTCGMGSFSVGSRRALAYSNPSLTVSARLKCRALQSSVKSWSKSSVMPLDVATRCFSAPLASRSVTQNGTVLKPIGWSGSYGQTLAASLVAVTLRA